MCLRHQCPYQLRDSHAKTVQVYMLTCCSIGVYILNVVIYSSQNVTCIGLIPYAIKTYGAIYSIYSKKRFFVLEYKVE